MLNLYLFNDYDSSATYGIGSYLKELKSALYNNEIKIHIVHLHSERQNFEIVNTNEIENWFVPEVIRKNTFSGFISNIENYCRNVIYLLRINIKETRNLIFHFNYNQYQYLAKELKNLFDCKTIITIHYMKWMLDLNGNLSRFNMIKKKTDEQKSSFEKSLLKTDEYEGLLFRQTDRVIALSQYTRNLLCDEYQIEPEKVIVIPNGLDDINLNMKTEKSFLRKKWHIAENELVILFVGRLHPVKGLMFLIKAFRKVLSLNPGCRLVIAGDGSYDMYMNEAKDICMKINFTGFLEKKELSELYQIADIGVFTSLSEQCSYVTMEMMMYSLPIITTSASGLAEMTEDCISSFQIPLIERTDKIEIDADFLADKIVYLLMNPTEAKLLGKNARKQFESKYTIDVFKNNMLNFYHSLYENK